ncbi:VanZ family protein [Muriicola sp.]|uniref:VanZ family protein n=1 Tax=Muriicola sp. TaxID=2020856 RepID=UPI00356AC3A7
MPKRNLFGIAFVSWMVFITVLSLVSFDDDTSLDLEIPYFDKIVHFTFYFIAGALGSLFLHSLQRGAKADSRRLLKFLLGLIGYGILIEVLQDSVTTYRSAELLDILANSVGAIIGILFIRTVNRKGAVAN